ncbi:MAG: hypothetical protein IJN02_10825 [Bacteroidales bacterium]|nr:hypothetical protein [Bacteroidales bacterium]
MKKIYLAVMIAAAAMLSCSKEIKIAPAVSFISEAPVLTDTTATFSIVCRGIPADQATVIPVIFGGSAQMGTDYEVSSEEFVYGGDAPKESITIHALKLGTEKTLSLTLDLPDGVQGGRYTKSEYSLQDIFGYISFDRPEMMMTDTTEINIVILDRSGNPKIVGVDTRITVNIDMEQSSAIEGEHFSFADNIKDVTIKAGSRSGALKLVSLDQTCPLENDRIVLKTSFSDRYSYGRYPEQSITVLGRKWETLEGSWKIDSLVTDSTFMDEWWEEEFSLLEAMPKFNSSDALKFDFSTSTFSPSFKSDFKNYFIGNSKLIKSKEMMLQRTDGETAELQTFMLDNTNRYFASDTTSLDKESLIGLRLMRDIETDAELLDLYIIDHTSLSFMPELEESGRYAAEKPVAASPGMYLNVIFRK